MKRWFGPKAIGWGASPASWRGWLLTGLLVAGLLALAKAPGVGRTGLLVGAGALVTAYLLVVAMTYGPSEAIAATRTRLAAVWATYLLAIAGVSAWGWSRLAGGPLAIHWSGDGVADRFAPGDQVLLAAPVAAAIAVAAIAVLTGGGRARSGAMAASIVVLSVLLLLHWAYVAAHLGVLT